MRGFTVIVPESCHICGSTIRKLYTRDGPTVCWVCIQMMGHAAGDPFSVSRRQRDDLRRDHADSVSLTETASGKQEWTWFK